MTNRLYRPPLSRENTLFFGVLCGRGDLPTVVSHIYAYDRVKTLSFILLIRRKSTESENESNV